jgi:uncharacterized protein (TIGR04255 family)
MLRAKTYSLRAQQRLNIRCTNEGVTVDLQNAPTPPRFMAKGYRYDHAPIVEALIELRCQLPDDVDLDLLAHLTDAEPAYPTAEPRVEFTAQIEGLSANLASRQLGHMFRRSDGARAVQAVLDRFVYSWLPPYESWEPFVAEAEEWWLKYRRLARPQHINRIGVRFINKIEIPAPQIEISDYLRTNVQLSPVLPQELEGFFMQTAIQLTKYSSKCHIVSTLVPPSGPDRTALILDIDVWKDVDLPVPSDHLDDVINSSLQELRAAKNFVFEASITDATRMVIS